MGFSGGSVVKQVPAKARNEGPGRSPGEGNGNTLQYPCLGNHKNRGAWWATVWGVAKSWTQLSTYAHIYHIISFTSIYPSIHV